MLHPKAKRGVALPSFQLSWNAQASDFKDAVETLSNVEAVEVTMDQWTDDAGFDFYRWTVSSVYCTAIGAEQWPDWV